MGKEILIDKQFVKETSKGLLPLKVEITKYSCISDYIKVTVEKDKLKDVDLFLCSFIDMIDRQRKLDKSFELSSKFYFDFPVCYIDGKVKHLEFGILYKDKYHDYTFGAFSQVLEPFIGKKFLYKGKVLKVGKSEFHGIFLQEIKENKLISFFTSKHLNKNKATRYEICKIVNKA